MLELAASTAGRRRRSTCALVADLAQNRALLYDKTGEEHYNLISALHKSMRNSDPDASVYWLARMVEAGEDPLYIARRLVRFASEDVGNADPQALAIAVAAKDAVHFIGMPEGNTALAQAAIYLATAPKSNAVYMAYNEAARSGGAGGRRAGAAAPAQRADEADEVSWTTGRTTSTPTTSRRAWPDMECLPPAHKGRRFYKPTDRGFEQEVRRRLAEWRAKAKAVKPQSLRPERPAGR